MELPIEEFQYQFDEAIKCKTSWIISWYEILERYSDCVYNIKIILNNNYYFTKNFYNEKKCSEVNNKKILDEIYPKWKEIEVIVNAEQDYIFLADKNIQYIKYDSNYIWTCTNNYIKAPVKTTSEIQNTKEIYNSQIYIFSWIILLLIIIIWFLSFKIYKLK